MQLMEILDQRIPYPKDGIMADLIFVLDIAFSCLSYKPEYRPSMKQVSQCLSAQRSNVPDYSLEIQTWRIVQFEGLDLVKLKFPFSPFIFPVFKDYVYMM